MLAVRRADKCFNKPRDNNKITNIYTGGFGHTHTHIKHYYKKLSFSLSHIYSIQMFKTTVRMCPSSGILFNSRSEPQIRVRVHDL